MADNARVDTDEVWQIWATAAVSALLAVLLVVWGVRARRQRREGRHGWWRTVVAGVLAFVLLLFAAGLAVGAHYGYLSSWRSLVGVFNDVAEDEPLVVPMGKPWTPPADTTESAGVVVHVTVQSTARGVPDSTVNIYLPPGYTQNPDTHYPTIYMLHGAPGYGTDWFDSGDLDDHLDTLIAAGTMPPVIAVAPDMDLGSSDEPVNYPGAGPDRGDFLTLDLVPWVDAHLRTKAEAGQRVLSGMSAGGYGALIDSVDKPDVWGGTFSAMPYTQPVAPQLNADPSGAPGSFPATAIPAAGNLSGHPFYLGYVSTEGPSQANEIAGLLTTQGATVKVEGVEGGHDWISAPKLAVMGLPWLAQQLGWIAGTPDSSATAEPTVTP